MVKKINFVGVIANVDDTILNVSLEHGFKIESMNENEGFDFISTLEGTTSFEIVANMTMNWSCFNNGKIYFVRNSFEPNNESLMGISKFDNELLHGYLIPTFRLMRLFKQGNICMPHHYYYKSTKSHISGGTILVVPSEIFSLKNSEISELQDFIKNTKLPFKHPYLNLALDNFEVSYQLLHQNLAFLSLMISLEALFNPGDTELRYRIARNTASIHAKDMTDFKIIFSEIKQLYDTRSELVHKGKLLIKQEDVFKLRNYVRKSINEVNKLDKTKDELLEILNARGFN